MPYKFYRYIDEKEKNRVEKSGTITTKDLEKEPDKYFTTDYLYYGGLNAQAYLSIWYKPHYRLGPLDISNREYGKINEPRRIWPAFGQHGGGYEVTLQVPVKLTKAELNTMLPIDVAGPEVDTYKAAGFFSNTRSDITEGIRKIFLELEIEITVSDENALIRDGGLVILLRRPQNIYPNELTISITLNDELKCLCVWVSAWADWDKIDFSKIQYLNFSFAHPYVINVKDPAAKQYSEASFNNKPPIREYVVFGPELLEEPTSEGHSIWRDIFRKLRPIFEKAFDLRFITSVENDGVHVSKPGAFVSLPGLCELP